MGSPVDVKGLVAYGVRDTASGYWVGVWNERQIAADVARKQRNGFNEVIPLAPVATLAQSQAALRELVRLKDLKERAQIVDAGMRDRLLDEYARCQPLAWKAACRLLTQEEEKL